MSDRPTPSYAWVDNALAYHRVDLERDGWWTRCNLPIKLGSRLSDTVPGLPLCDRCRQAN